MRDIKEKIKQWYRKYDTKDIQFISVLFSILSTVVMTYLTIIMSIANDRMAEANDRMAESNDKMSISGDQSFILARYQHTFALCQRFDETYGDIKNIEHFEYKIWEENDTDYEISVNKNDPMYDTFRHIKERWAVRDSTNGREILDERISFLMNNNFFQQILQYFEEAKILHKKQLLDVDAFENDFVGVLYRLQNTTCPTIDEYIQHVRSLSTRINKDKIWDGYYYCLQNVITQNYRIPRTGKINKIYVTPDKKVRKGDVLLVYTPIDSDKNEFIISDHNGEIVDLYIQEGMVSDSNSVLLRISQKDYDIVP